MGFIFQAFFSTSDIVFEPINSSKSNDHTELNLINDHDEVGYIIL